MSKFFGSIFGALFIIFIIWIVIAIIVKLFKVKVNQEDFEGCFTIIGYIGLGIAFIVFLLNKCSSPA